MSRAGLFMDGVKVGDVQELRIDPLSPPVRERADKIARQFRELPKHGTPAAQLTDRDKLALALAVGVPCEVVPGEAQNTIRLRSKVPFGVCDRGDGGYVIGWQQPSGEVATTSMRVKS